MDWSDIPSDLLERIGKQHNTKVDNSQIRAVCRSWRSSLPPFNEQRRFPSIQIDHILLRNDQGNIVTSGKIFTVSPESFDAYYQRFKWLMLVRSGVEYEKAPLQMYPQSLSLVRNKRLNLLDFRALELARTYRLHWFSQKVWNCKVAMSEAEYCPELMILASKVDDNLYVRGFCSIKAGLYYSKNIASSNDQMRYCCTKLSDVEFDDVMFHRGMFYAVAWDGKTLVLDSSSPSHKLLNIASPVPDGVIDRHYLVESSGDLLLVRQQHSHYHNDDPQFRVFKLNNAGLKRWVEIKHLTGLVLFVSSDCCFSSPKFSGLRSNCVYYPDSDLKLKPFEFGYSREAHRGTPGWRK